jgi:hypothetical protein
MANNIDDMFPSKYLRASDVTSKPSVTIAGARVETIGSGPGAQPKVVVQFQELPKLLPLNKTNANSIVELAGTRDWERWTGLRLQLVPAKTEFQGRRVDCVRIEAADKVPF